MKNTEHTNKQIPPFYTKNEPIIFWGNLVLLGKESSKCADMFWDYFERVNETVNPSSISASLAFSRFEVLRPIVVSVSFSIML